jgi:hypothetical protein
MKRQSIDIILKLITPIIVSISVAILLCQSGSKRGIWTVADSLADSNEKEVYSASFSEEITPGGVDDHAPAGSSQGTIESVPQDTQTEEESTGPNLDFHSTRFHVSKFGDNSDGLSWETAWNELDQINWDVIQPGDTILLDGGRYNMTYSTQLNVKKSGLHDTPITIQRSTEAGRDGQVIIFGGRSVPLPYCNQPDYIFESDKVREIGILIDAKSWIVIDGGKWNGIIVHGHNKHGIQLTMGSDKITLKNLEIYDNGFAKHWSGGWKPESSGLFFSGTNLLFQRLIVHDNGQDALQSEGGLENFTLLQSWLYNARRHPYVDESFNYCSHTDGFQIYNGGKQSGFLIEESIIGPGLTNGLILGSISQSGRTYAVIDNLTLRDVLLTKAADNSILGYPNTQPVGWSLDHVTLDCSNTKYECLYLEGSDHEVTNSIFLGGKITLSNSEIETSNNCQWDTIGSQLGIKADPLFEDANRSDPLSLDNYMLSEDSGCVGSGSRLTSIGQLICQLDPDRVLEGLSWDASQSYTIAPFQMIQGSIHQQIETDNPSLGGRASFRFKITTPGDYLIRVLVDAPNTSSNSFFVNIDEEPTSPRMIWDIDITNGFEERIVSWRGNGTDLDNEYSPKVFELDSGTHELIFIGREHFSYIKEVSLIKARRLQNLDQTSSGIGCCKNPKEPTT